MLDHMLGHPALTGVALALLLFVQLGVLLIRWGRAAAGAVIGTVGVIQTISSLGLPTVMIPLPFLGLGAGSAVATLFLHGFLLIVRNT